MMTASDGSDSDVAAALPAGTADVGGDAEERQWLVAPPAAKPVRIGAFFFGGGALSLMKNEIERVC